jgi:dihydrofolate reductase
MSRVVVSEFLTLDGVYQAPGGPEEDTREGFEHGGWQMPYNDDIGGKAIDEGIAEAGGLLLGRRTYDIFAAYWPSEEGPIANPLNSMPKFVASTTLREPLEWNNSTLLKGDVAEEVAKLKEQPDKDLLVIGSGDLIQTLIKHELVDEYRLMVHPVVLGSGRRLFAEGIPRTGLTLVDATPTGTGVLILTYRPGEEPGA